MCVTRTTCGPSRGRVQAGLELSDLLLASDASAHDVRVCVDVDKPFVREEGVGQEKLGQELLASIGRDGDNTENQVGGMVDLGDIVCRESPWVATWHAFSELIGINML